MDWRTLAPYWIPAVVAVAAVAVLVLTARTRAGRRRSRRTPAPSSSVDPSYLDSSHPAEPQTEDRPRQYGTLDAGTAPRPKRRRP